MIGVFDSGLGGLTVVRELERVLPDAALLYFGDTARYPYGQRSSEVIQRYALQDAQFLIAKGATMILIACNTASAVASETLKNELSVPVFEVITPAVDAALAVTKTKRIGLLGTRATVASGIYDRLLAEKGDYTVVANAAPLLVPIVEEGFIDKPETKTIIRKYYAPIRRATVDTLILGCTHYPMLKSIIAKRAGKRVTVVDPAVETAQRVAAFVREHPEHITHGESTFYLSDVTGHARAVARRWLGHDITFQPSGVLEG